MALVQSPRPSLSTAREPFTSSGRGGSGNIRRTSVGRSSEPSVDVSDVVSLREKEGSSSRFVSVGRGGSGNIQPPSPDLADHPLTAAILSEHRDTEERYERQIRKRHEESKVVASSGRGGSGNISHNRRSKSRPPGSTSVRKGRRRTSETTTIDALHLINRESLSNITLADRGEGTSRSGAEPVDGPSCSPTAHNFQQRSTKKRNFLKIWKRSARPRSSISSLERISIADTTSNDVNQRDSDSSIDHLSLHRVSTSGHSGDTASTVSSYTSSGSRSLSSSHMSVQSLPTLPENREQGSGSCVECVFPRCATSAHLFRSADLWYLVPSPLRLLDFADTFITYSVLSFCSSHRVFAKLPEFTAFTVPFSLLLHSPAQHEWKVIVGFTELAVYLYKMCVSYD